jgi:hypothetical protein
LIKSQSHLQKKFADLPLTYGSIAFDLSSDPSNYLLVGDVNDDNILDIIDIAQILSVYTDLSVSIPPGTPEDVNFDGFITIDDAAFAPINYTDLEILGVE